MKRLICCLLVLFTFPICYGKSETPPESQLIEKQISTDEMSSRDFKEVELDIKGGLVVVPDLCSESCLSGGLYSSLSLVYAMFYQQHENMKFLISLGIVPLHGELGVISDFVFPFSVFPEIGGGFRYDYHSVTFTAMTGSPLLSLGLGYKFSNGAHVDLEYIAPWIQDWKPVFSSLRVSASYPILK